MNPKVYPVAIIGGGSAGVMAALRSVLNNDETIFFPGTAKHKKKSRAFWVSKVENMPGHLNYKKGIVEPNQESLEWLAQSDFKEKFIWKKNLGIDSISRKGEHYELKDTAGEKYFAKYVVLCTGVMDVQPKIDGEISEILPYANVQLADYCLRCDGHHVLNKNTVVIGHNSSAAWVAIMLHERYQMPNTTILTNGETEFFDSEVSQLISKYKIKIETSKIKKINGRPKEKHLESFELENGTIIKSEICFISLGMIVYNELAKGLGAKTDERGFVVTNNKGESNIPKLYIAGDLRAGIKKQIYTAWDSAVDACDDINTKLRREKRTGLLF
jgi:thioredoxin reductase (NADPH)